MRRSLGTLVAGWIILAMLVLGSMLAGAHAAPARTLRFEQLSVAQGLAQESVLAIAQDADGFMWFGSQTGLSRFDGYRVTVYRHEVGNPGSLANNWVRVLHVDRGGRLWIGTDGGLDRFDPATRSFTHFTPKELVTRGNGNRHIHAIVDDGKHGLWLATGDGLQHFDKNTGIFKSWHHDARDPRSLASDEVNALALDAGGRLWVGTGAGLDSLAPGADGFEHHRHGPADAKFDAIRALLVDASQTLWVGSVGGLATSKLGSKAGMRQRLGPAHGLRPGEISVLFQDTDGIVWAGTHDSGLYRWRAAERRFTNYAHVTGDANSLGDNQVSALFRDRVGTFWVGTWYAGVSRVDLGSGGFARIVKHPGVPNSMADSKVRAILGAEGGKLWLGTNTALNLFDPASGAAQVFAHQPDNPNSLGDIPASALARDRRGLLWVGSRNGITSFDPRAGKYTRHSLANGDPDSDTIRGMLVDRQGMLWIASRGGLHRFDPVTRQFVTYRHDPADSASLADNVVRPILEDRRGQLWVGTFDGLDLLDRATGKFRHFRHDPNDASSLSHDEVHHVLEDRQGNLWVGTAVGLNKMLVGTDGKVRFQRFGTKDGLGDDAVAAMLEDDDGNLWISTNSGLTRFSPASGRWRTFTSGDGTIDGAYFDNSAWRAPDGTLYFGGFNGITAFNPRAISENLVAPRAVLTGFQVFNRPVEEVHPGLLKGQIENATEITLGAADTVFSLEFSALHYAAPERNRFAYQLVGFDQDWVQTDASKRFATYTNLDPGSYLFQVKAANKDDVWSAAPAALKITILPPWWKTWWARAAALLLVLGGAGGVYRARLGALGRQKAQLEQLVGVRTEEIEQQNRLLERQTRELQLRRMEAEAQRADAELGRYDAERQKQEAERQKENVELAHRNISVLSEIGRELTATLDMETIMDTVYRHVHHLMDARIFSIGFLDEARAVIEFPFAIDSGVHSPLYRRALDNPNQLAVWCLTHRREVFINDFNAEYDNYLADPGVDRNARPAREDGKPASVAVSMMYVPLIVKERVMGVLCVQSTGRNAYRRVHLDMLQTLASHAAVALDNARAYRELEDTEARLLEQEKQVRLNTDELALANRALQDNEERLRLAKQRAEDATRQKSEFLANMSHEMRTPLAGVIGMLGFALRDSHLQSRTREQILRAAANAQSLLTIINDLLDFSKIEAGKLTLENIDFALAATLDHVASLFEEQAAVHSIGFEIGFDAGLPRFVAGDPTRLRQVLVNLVGNAFKFTNRGSVAVRVERRAEDQLAHAPVNMIRFSVTDTGIGIAPAALARLFQKFEQADSTTTRRYGGTGLGLAICRQLVELMGGQISVTSREGEGSTFSFVLPLADGVAPLVAPRAPRAPHSHRLKVLCAEDFPTNQIIIRMMLEEMGHEVEIADNGVLALAACARTRFDLILMDGRMPELDGAGATRLIRAGGPPGAPVLDQELMIVALTANASEEDRTRYLACGMDDFLSKPVDEGALHQQLSRAIERQLQRRIALPALTTGAPKAPSTADLDAMFGVSTGPTPLAVAAARNAGRRTTDLNARVRAAFAGDLPARRAELEAAIERRDGHDCARLLHGLRGSAAYLGAAELRTLSRELEQAAADGSWERIRAAWPRMRELLGDFEDEAGLAAAHDN